jgi:endoglucanase
MTAWLTRLVLSLALATLLLAPAAADFAGRRGLNFEVWQDWTVKSAFLAPAYDRANFPDWASRVDDAKLKALRAQGFDFVRLNVDPSPFFWVGEAGAAPLYDGVLSATRRLHAAGFAVIVDLHILPEMEGRPDGRHDVLGTGGRKETLFQRYLALVAEMARRLAPLPPERTALELMNEPDQDWFSTFVAMDRWPGQLAQLHAAARKAAPGLTLVMTGARGGGVEGLLRLDPKPFATDPNLIWSVHYYEPMAITHAGQPWETTPQRFLTHLPFPASALDAAKAERLLAAARRGVEAGVKDAGQRRDLSAALGKALAAYRASDASEATIAADLARVGDWARRHGVPAQRVLLGEFGVFQDEADPAARLAILKATREAAEKQGFLWAVYTAGLTKPRASFGVIGDAQTLAVEPAVKAALGLAP